MFFKDYIKKLRVDANKSLRQIEKETSLSKSYLSMIESGKREKPSPDVLKKLADCYNIDFKDMLEAAGFLGADSYIIDRPELPVELRKIGVEYMELAKYMQDEQIPPDDLKKLVETIKALKK